MPNEADPPVTSTGPYVDYFWSHPQFMGMDEEIAAKENMYSEGSHNSINIPWLAGLMISQGNAMTDAIARNCTVFEDLPYGEVSGMGSAGGYQGMGGSSGGLVVSW